jgi:hypothetical protein
MKFYYKMAKPTIFHGIYLYGELFLTHLLARLTRK